MAFLFEILKRPIHELPELMTVGIRGFTTDAKALQAIADDPYCPLLVVAAEPFSVEGFAQGVELEPGEGVVPIVGRVIPAPDQLARGEDLFEGFSHPPAGRVDSSQGVRLDPGRQLVGRIACPQLRHHQSPRRASHPKANPYPGKRHNMVLLR